ncbi:phage portal protein [Sphingomonas sp.]|jgi:HK97 family phage portal protein|uniref:phage portal protein n=1 Tax=Sphingomonas sp. TaxID=28214 RepID=UPI002D7E42B0|nr:phage portal protein [Sphingomonas sp.]HEU0043846.1 phage portal protein [Sphingomonas sp.]
MKLFGWRREASRPALSTSGSRAGAVSVGEWPPSYEAQVRSGYCGNAIAQRAVRLVAEAVGGAPLEASSPALLALVQGRTGGAGLLESVAAQLQLHGNAFVQVLRSPEDDPAALYPLRPERVSVEADAGGWPAAYRYTVGGRVARLAADGPRPDVIHLRGFHPLDDHYGLGCLGGAANAIAVHNAAGVWNKALLDNAARPSGALVYEPGDGSALSPEQFARLRSEMEQGFAGAAQAGRPMLLEGGLRWQPLSLTPADMDFVGLKAAAAREIALAFGVPPMLLGLPGDSTHANYREANRALWRLAVLPLAGAVLDGLAQGLSGWFPDPWLRVDLDGVPALADDRAALWASVTAADFITRAEKRAMLGFEEDGS